MNDIQDYPSRLGNPASRKFGSRPCVLVDEMGFLSELYGAADWAYVGGGFGAGVHSTIEPAIQGIPILIGPVRADHFTEIGQLQPLQRALPGRVQHDCGLDVGPRGIVVRLVNPIVHGTD